MKRFGAQAQRFLDNLRAKGTKRYRSICRQAFKNAVLNTPSRLSDMRANWRMNVGVSDSSYDPNATDETERRIIERETSTTDDLTLKDRCVIFNNVPLAVETENGWRGASDGNIVKNAILQTKNDIIIGRVL